MAVFCAQRCISIISDGVGRLGSVPHMERMASECQEIERLAAMYF